MRTKLIVLLFTTGLTCSLWAQTPTASILGTVKDETGAVLPGVSITAKSLDTNQTRTAVTDDRGLYRLALLPLGTYEVQTELAGFRTEIRRPITLTIGREAVVDFTLKVGGIEDKVLVTGEAPLVETTTAVTAGLVDDKKIRDLPLNGRDFAQLALLQEGVVQSSAIGRTQAGNEGVKLALAGTRVTQTAFLLDGTDIRNSFEGAPAGATGTVSGVETVREFKVITGAYSAEYGRFTGGVVTAVTKSGTNELHGSVYEFLRNSALDARNFFDRDPRNPLQRSEPPLFIRNQFGFSLGGPIVRDKTFYFGSYEGMRQRLSSTLIQKVPNLAARQGLIVPVSPRAKPYVDLYPLPNGRELGGGLAEAFVTGKFPANDNLYTIRVDHQFSDSDSFFARYTLDQSDKEVFDTSVTALVYDYRYQYLTLSEKRIFSPSVINEARFGFSRSKANQTPVETVPIDPALRFSRQPNPLLGRFLGGGLDAIGAFLQLFQIPTNYQYSDDLTFSRGHHYFKAGFAATRFQYNVDVGVRTHGVYIFTSLPSLLTAAPLQFDGFATASYRAGMRQSLWGFYFQDDWKLSPRWTWNLGARYEFITSPTEVAGRIANLVRINDSALHVGNPYFDNPSLKNISPRVGFAWDVRGDAKTSVRGGFGLFHDQLTAYLWGNSSVFNPPFALRVSRRNPPFGPGADPYTGAGLVPALWSMGDPKQPYVMQFSLNLQHEVLRDTVLSIGYQGSQGRHLPRLSNDANLVVPQKVDGRTFFPVGGVKRNPNFSGVRMELWDGNSFYNALKLGLNKRFSGGLQFQMSYTTAKTIDDSSNVNHADANDGNGSSGWSVPDPDDRSSSHGFSGIHIRHAFTFNFGYDFPWRAQGIAGALLGGWQVNGIMNAATGSPASLNINFDNARSGQFELSQRPDLRPGASNNPVLSDGRDPNRYYDTGAFAVAPPGFFGNLGRNTLTGPGILTFDFGLNKSFKMTEKATVQFRAEAFNVFNRANFGLPGRNVFVLAGTTVSVDPTAGLITTTTTTSRQIQFALKVLF